MTEEPELVSPPVLGQSRGFPAVWLVLLLLFAYLAYASVARIVSPSGLSADQEWLIKFSKDYEQEFSSATSAQSRTSVLKKALDQLSRANLKTKGAEGTRQRLSMILRGEMAEPVGAPVTESSADDISDPDLKGKVEADRKKLNDALNTLYIKRPTNKQELNELRNTLVESSSGGFPYNLAILRAGGHPATEVDTKRFLLLGVLFAVGLLAGVIAIFVCIALVAGRALIPKKFPLGVPEPAIADELGLKMLTYILVFAFAGAWVTGLFSGTFGDGYSEMIGSILLAVVFVQIARAKWISNFPGLKGFGFSKQGLARQIGFGVFGYLMAIPVVLAVGWVSSRLLPDLPGQEHPVTKELLDPRMLLPTFFTAVLFAPFVEELFFRGCLFQGLALRLRRPWLALLISSVAFASIHPQGMASWLPLASVGAMAGFTFWLSGSVLSAMVMHGLWNLSVLVLTLALQ